MSRDKVNPLLLLGLGGALVLLFTQRKTVMVYGAKALDAANRYLFQASLDPVAQPYSDMILQVAREQGVDPFIIYALGMRESGWGTQLAADMTGDNGHGRGIMQIDDRSWGSWLASNDWTDPYTNVTKGVQILQQAIKFFSGNASIQGYTDGTNVSIDRSAAKLGVAPGIYPDPRPLAGDALTLAALAAYNSGVGNVLMAIAAGKSPDTTTTQGNYSAWVWNVMSEAAASFQSSAT